MKQFESTKTEIDKGLVLLEASAGTGKTFTLAILVVRLVVEKNLPLRKILAVTFTNAATAELKKRVGEFLREALGYCDWSPEPDESRPLREYIPRIISEYGRGDVEKRLRLAVESIDEMAIYTIHSFCQRALTEYAFEAGTVFDREMVQDETPIFKEIQYNFWRKQILTLSEPEYLTVVATISTPEVLHYRISTLLQFSDTELVGAVDEKPDIVSAQKKIEELVVSIYSKWCGASSNLIPLLRKGNDEEVFDKRSFKLDKILCSLENYSTENLQTYIDIFTTLSNPKCKKGATAPEHDYFDYLKEVCPDLLLLQNELIQKGQQLIAWVETQYIRTLKTKLAQLKLQRNQCSFNDIISDTVQAVHNRQFTAALRNRFGCALVDEFQDTDAGQFTIFNTIFGDGFYFFMIGDPKQAIYQFRGGDVYAYLKARDKVPQSQRYTLNKNYRSEKNLIGVLNDTFLNGGDSDQFITRGIHYEKVESGSAERPLRCRKAAIPPLELWYMEETVHKSSSGNKLSKQMAARLMFTKTCSEIAQILQKENEWQLPAKSGNEYVSVTAADIGILVSSHNDASTLKMMLNKHNIPAVTIKQGSLWRSAEAAALEQLLELLLQPSNTQLLKTVLYTEPFAWSLHTIEESIETEWLRRFFAYHQMWLSKGISVALRTLFTSEKIFARLRTVGDYRAITNYRQLFELVQSIETSTGKSPLRLLNTLRQTIADHQESEQEERLENDESAVNIVTIHSSKGLEYPIVFVPTPWDLTYALVSNKSNKRIIHPFTNDLDGKRFYLCDDDVARNQAIRERYEEYQRLFYVALTRASYRLYCSYVPVADDPDNPAQRFLAPFTETTAEKKRNSSISIIKIDNEKTDETVIPDQLTVSGSAETFDFQTIPPGKESKSYSSLVVHGRSEAILQEGIPEPGTIHSFIKGSRTGNAWHRIFEMLDYPEFQKGEALKDTVLRAMEEFGFTDSDNSFRSVEKMVSDVLTVELNAQNDTIQLCSVTDKCRSTEFSFSLLSKGVQCSQIRKIVAEGEGFSVSINDSDFQGYLTGFIDLVFAHNGRYYVADWKSNWLGCTTDDYSPRRVEEAMKEKEYHLQYILYITALSQFLKHRPGTFFDYDTHIGGAFYLFLRGIEAGKETGIYYHKPRKRTISQLLKLFTGEEL